MSKMLYYAMGLTLAALLSAGCVSGQAGGFDLPEPSLTLTADDNGGEFPLRVGQYVKISLKENPSTGYSWYFQTNNGRPGPQRKADHAVQLAGERYLAPDTDLVGAPGVRELMVRAAQPGTVYVIGNCLRSWDSQAAPTLTVRYKFTVR